jgi:TonB family protein
MSDGQCMRVLLAGACVLAVAACSVSPPKPSSREFRISNFKQGLMHRDANGQWYVYSAGSKFNYVVNGSCTANHLDYACMWWGVSFDYASPAEKAELRCVTRNGEAIYDANPNFQSETPGDSTNWTLNLQGHNASRVLPLYVTSNGPFAKDVTDSTTCTFEGKTVVEYQFTKLAGTPNGGTVTLDTPLRIGPSHPPHIGQAYYPKDSLALGEQGTCDMAVTVEPDGSVSESHLVKSSGSTRLDAACAATFSSDVRFVPATKNGIPVRASVVIPVVWCISDCRAR